MKRRFFIGLLVLNICMLSCDDKDTEEHSKDSPLTVVLAHFGGVEAIHDITSIAYTNTGDNYEFEEEEPHRENPINNLSYSYRYTAILQERKARMEYEQLQFNFPLIYTGSALQIINDDKGSISGEYNIISYYAGDTAPKALFSSRIEAVLKNCKMSNPIALIKDVIASKGVSHRFLDDKLHIATDIENLDIILHIDPQTHVPIKASILEGDFLLGDVTFEVIYDDWIDVGDSTYPSALTFIYDNQVIKREILSDIVFNPETAGLFAVEDTAEDLVYNTEQAAFGIISSQWYHRLFATNFPFDQPFNNGALAVGNFNPSHYISDQVKLIGRPDAITWSAAIKTSEGVYIVEPPLNNRWTQSIINAVKFEYPEEDIVGGIVTHAHFDHSSGLRELAFESKNIYVGQESVDRTIATIENKKYQLLHDNLSRFATSVDVTAVDTVTYLANGEIEIHQLKTDDLGVNPHAHDMLIVYVPAYEVIITSDMINAGLFMEIYTKNTAKSFDEETQDLFKQRAQFLVDYIREKNLIVSKVAALHGGLTDYQNILNMIK